VLHGLYIGDAYRSGGPVGDDELNESSSMLILRCLSVLPLTFRVSSHTKREECRKKYERP
jgi:hypothetical protein